MDNMPWLIVPVQLLLQSLPLGCNPFMECYMLAIVQENRVYIMGINPDPILLALENALMDHMMILQKPAL